MSEWRPCCYCSTLIDCGDAPADGIPICGGCARIYMDGYNLRADQLSTIYNKGWEDAVDTIAARIPHGSNWHRWIMSNHLKGTVVERLKG